MFLNILIAQSSEQTEEYGNVHDHHQDFEAGCP